MNQKIINEISANLNIKIYQVENTLKMLSDGNTIPFIARYRKEATGNLDEEVIRNINEVYEYQVNLSKRKEDVIRLIEEKGLMTEELRINIINCKKIVEVDDLYRPYKEKKKTKATEAIKNGLEPLAKVIINNNHINDLEELIKEYINDNVKTKEEVLMGVKYIIAEWISDNAEYRKWIRRNTYLNGYLKTKIKKDAIDEKKTYEMYYEYQEQIRYAKPHRVLAINRGEKEKILTAKIEIDESNFLEYLESNIIINKKSNTYEIIIDAIKDSYKRLISPSIEREIRSELTEQADNASIDVFGKNLEKLLLQPPIKEMVVLGLDPAYRTGCKLAVVDNTGKVLDISVIYPHEPRNEKEKSKDHIIKLINKYNIDIIAIGNGTASRESETFIADIIKDAKRNVSFIIVNEAGASVYSASKVAIEEFPNLNVEERSAISIARRLQDPLSELVKIDSKSIGIGQYQHDVSSTKLEEALDFTVTKTVNNVGVNINTASKSLLKYVSGMTKTVIDKILKYRDKAGRIDSREQLKKEKLCNEKVFEQSIGFIRISDGDNPLDKTPIHPESYKATNELLSKLNLKIEDVGSQVMNDVLNSINKEEFSELLQIDIYTLEDIIKSLKQPNRDPRDELDKPILKSDVLKLEDLKKGMKLQGTIRNVVDFGAFIDIGLKNDGLVHISKITDRYINHPLEVINVGDIVYCYVEDILYDKKRVSLTMIEPK